MAKLSKTPCRHCGGEVWSPRRTFCSQECVDQWLILNDWGYARRAVLNRDKGVCAICGEDTPRLKKMWRAKWTHWNFHKLVAATLRHWGFTLGIAFWQADHIVPRYKGGDNRLENLRTLCVPCHKVVSAQQAAERAFEKRVAKETLFAEGV